MLWKVTNDQALPIFELVCNVYFVARRTLMELHARDLVADLDEGRGGGVEEATRRDGGQGARQAASGKHREWMSAVA